MQLSIVHPGLYRRPETFRQQTETTHLGLILSGVDYHRYFTRDGREIGELEKGQPYLSLVPPGVVIDFRFGKKRENWVIQCTLSALSISTDGLASQLEYDHTEIRLPLFRPIPLEHALVLREKFAAVRELWLEGTPAARLAAELTAAGLIAEYLRVEPLESTESTAAQFRRLIDGDTRFHYSLAELSRQAGASPGHLRRLFREVYRIDPGEYRARRRLGRIMTLIDGSTLSIKEIAEEVGMRHVTHLHLFLKEHCGRTPGELLRQHRGN